MRNRKKQIEIAKATHSIVKSESRRAGLPMGEWLGAAAVAYAAQTDPTFLRMCQELYAALAGFGEVLSIAPAPPPPPPPPPPPNYGETEDN